MKNRFYLLFASLTAFLFVIIYFLSHMPTLFNTTFLFISTAIVAMVSLFSFFLGSKHIYNPSAHKFVNGVMLATMIKFLLLVLSIGSLIYFFKNEFHKADIFFILFCYMAYTILEAVWLAAMSRKGQ
ncbi:MAG: hypothetical protein R2831_11365 [Chitinophagaceae bacterium]